MSEGKVIKIPSGADSLNPRKSSKGQSSTPVVSSTAEAASKDSPVIALACEPLDGGIGWAMLLLCWITIALVDGVHLSFGIIYPYLLKDFDAKPASVTVIGSLQRSFYLFSGLLVHPMYKLFGSPKVIVAGAVLTAISLVLSSFSPNLVIMALCFGVGAGFGQGMIFNSSIIVASIYFEKKRALANGIVLSGTGFGMFVLSPIISLTCEGLGWRNSVRIAAGISFSCIPFALLLHIITPPMQLKPWASQPSLPPNSCTQVASVPVFIELRMDKSLIPEESRRTASESVVLFPVVCRSEPVSTSIPPFSEDSSGSNRRPSLVERTRRRKRRKAKLMEMFPFYLHKSGRFSFCVLSGFFLIWGIVDPLVYLPDFAVHKGFNRRGSSTTLTVLGVFNMLSRFLAGYLADKIHDKAFYLFTGLVFFLGCLDFTLGIYPCITCIWVYSACYGIALGSIFALRVPVFITLTSLKIFADAYGINLVWMGIGALIGTPFAGWLYYTTGDYSVVFYESGCVVLISGFFWLIAYFCFEPPNIRR